VAGEELLAHMLEGSCTDPDCELHNARVAIEEGVWDDAVKAFWIAGFLVGWEQSHRTTMEHIEEIRENDPRFVLVTAANGLGIDV
jgi:hypothetical protein